MERKLGSLADCSRQKEHLGELNIVHFGFRFKVQVGQGRDESGEVDRGKIKGKSF